LTKIGYLDLERGLRTPDAVPARDTPSGVRFRWRTLLTFSKPFSLKGLSKKHTDNAVALLEPALLSSNDFGTTIFAQEEVCG